MRFAELDAVTVDGYGTLVRLLDPVPSLVRSLAERGLDRDPELVARGVPRPRLPTTGREAVRGRDPDSLARLRCDCTRVFLDAAGVDLEPESFVDDFMAAIRFEAVPGAIETLERLRGRGPRPGGRLQLGRRARRAPRADSAPAACSPTVVTSAEAGAAKPDPAVFRLALERLGVEPARALHVGDEDEDEQGAAAAGMRFAPAPLATAFAGWVVTVLRSGKLTAWVILVGGPRAARLREPGRRREAAEGRRLPVLDRGGRARPVRDHPRRRPGDRAAGLVRCSPCAGRARGRGRWGRSRSSSSRCTRQARSSRRSATRGESRA